MAKGDLHNPYIAGPYVDYQGRVLSISVPWNSSTRAIQDGTAVHRDVGCQYRTIVFDNPPTGKRLPSMTDAQTDLTFTAQQVRNATGFRTIDDLLAAGQITAEP